MPWSDDPERFVKLALAPARVQFVDLDWPRHRATVFVPTDQYALTRGENAANQALASELTGWTIDVAAVDTV